MCRWLAYTGSSIYPEAFLFQAENSLIDQSLNARMGTTPTNGDGFGLGWYSEDKRPGVFRDILPAWNDDNLRNVASHISSPLFFAHVRAATNGSISRTNCHPFQYKNWLFMHNGQIGNFNLVHRELDLLISDEYYHHRQGTTDSETFFYLLLTNGLRDDPATAFKRSIGQVLGVMKQQGADRAFRMTAAVSDGVTLYALRYSSDDHAPSLYVGVTLPNGATGDALMVVSEPLDSHGEHWQEVGPSQLLTVCAGAYSVQDFSAAG